ncbi:hypothetical protein YC2023_081851 [Brassica napus]
MITIPTWTTKKQSASHEDVGDAPVESDPNYNFWQDSKISEQVTVADAGTSGKPPPLKEYLTKMARGEQRQWGGGSEITLDVDQRNEKDVSRHTLPTPASTARTSFDA